MYSSLSSAEHHIFSRHGLRSWSRSRIRIVSLPTRGTSRRFTASCCHQPHSPAGATFGRIAAHHGDDPLLLAVLQNGRGAGPRLVVKRGFEATVLVTMADLPNGLRSEGDHAGNARRTNALSQLEDTPRLVGRHGPAARHRSTAWSTRFGPSV